MIIFAIIVIVLFCIWIAAITTHTVTLKLDANFYEPKDYLMSMPTLRILKILKVINKTDDWTDYEVVLFCPSRQKWIMKLQKKWYDFVYFVNNY